MRIASPPRIWCRLCRGRGERASGRREEMARGGSGAPACVPDYGRIGHPPSVAYDPPGPVTRGARPSSASQLTQ